MDQATACAEQRFADVCNLASPLILILFCPDPFVCVYRLHSIASPDSISLYHNCFQGWTSVVWKRPTPTQLQNNDCFSSAHLFPSQSQRPDIILPSSSAKQDGQVQSHLIIQRLQSRRSRSRLRKTTSPSSSVTNRESTQKLRSRRPMDVPRAFSPPRGWTCHGSWWRWADL